MNHELSSEQTKRFKSKFKTHLWSHTDAFLTYYWHLVLNFFITHLIKTVCLPPCLLRVIFWPLRWIILSSFPLCIGSLSTGLFLFDLQPLENSSHQYLMCVFVWASQHNWCNNCVNVLIKLHEKERLALSITDH